MRIGLVLETSPTSGGAYQQSLSTVELLAINGTTAYEILVFTPFKKTRQQLQQHGIDAVQFQNRFIRHLDIFSSTTIGGAILRRLRRLGFRRLGRHLDALLDDHRIDLVLFTDVTEVSLRIGDHPFIMTVMDLDHFDHPEYSEHFLERGFAHRENILRSTLTRAIAVIANSKSGADRIATIYDVDPTRIIELPFIPSLAVRGHTRKGAMRSAKEIRDKYDLPSRYVFYPAYYLYHKNHLYLLEALVELERQHGIVLHAVFCGRDPRGEKATIERQVQALKLRKRVHLLNFVPDEDIPALYESAIAVASPSPFGPTNLQPLEAAALGCPVICSDLPGSREQMGDAALYCDLSKPSSLADHLAALIQDTVLLNRLREAGRQRVEELSKMNYDKRLSFVFDNFAYVRRRWAWPEDRA